MKKLALCLSVFAACFSLAACSGVDVPKTPSDEPGIVTPEEPVTPITPIQPDYPLIPDPESPIIPDITVDPIIPDIPDDPNDGDDDEDDENKYVPSDNLMYGNTLYLHYYRPNGDYDDWQLYTWYDNVAEWSESVTIDESGLVFRIGLYTFFDIEEYYEDKTMNFIVTQPGWIKDGGDNNVSLSETQKIGNSYHWYVKQGNTNSGSNRFSAVVNAELPEEHVHTYSEEWSSNEIGHWRVATCGHSVYTDLEYHDIVNGKCSVCGYEPESEEVYVTFDAGAGAFLSGQSEITIVPDNSGKITLNTAPVRSGYAFSGWFDANGNEFSSSTAYTKSTAFAARYISGSSNSVFDALFSESSIVSVDINMSDSEWKKLDRDYTSYTKSPIYRYADYVTIGIDNGSGMLYFYYDEVGVRMKGNTSRHRFYGDTGFYDTIHMKLSFKETFDDIADGYTQSELKTWTSAAERSERKNRLFGGMEKLDLKYNSTLDESYIREVYAMKMFRESGVLAPHITLGSVRALEQDTRMRNLGVYRIHEPIDEAFITRNLAALGDTAVGDLWKCTWGNSSTGASMTNDNLDYIVGVNDELNNLLYAYDKKTNKKKGLDSIKDFIRGINVSNVNFDNYIDTDYFAKFEAVNYILGNPDCIRNNANNYYVYFRKSDGKAIIIPYDYDRCLGLTYGLNCMNGMTEAEPFTRTPALGELRNPLYKGLIVKGAPYDAGSVLMRYRSNLIGLAASDLVKIETFNALKVGYQARYSSYTANAIGNSLSFNTNTGNNIEVSNYFTAKLKTLNNNIDNYR